MVIISPLICLLILKLRIEIVILGRVIHHSIKGYNAAVVALDASVKSANQIIVVLILK